MDYLAIQRPALSNTLSQDEAADRMIDAKAQHQANAFEWLARAEAAVVRGDRKVAAANHKMALKEAKLGWPERHEDIEALEFMQRLAEASWVAEDERAEAETSPADIAG